MIPIRESGALQRGAIIFALILLLALRLLSPAGFMPSFDHGAVIIVACPDAGGSGALHHHDHSKAGAHQACPYAAAAALGGMGDETAALAAILVLGLALLLGRPFAFLERHRTHDRPPLRGPPIPA